ncbi:MAG TPA: 2-oxo-4-hydroxy-4-carboxy-5-ureidoimidazoline decarboxylase [Longimicrobiales bacterium]|nr:2-oxo-4-hydroxy-4-carboxy-5-ureidoimidazoline decarboxylase [Longimicrobiales bacterium]
MTELVSLATPALKASLEQCGLSESAASDVLEHGPFENDDQLCRAVDAVMLGLDEAELRTLLEAVPPPAVEHGHPDVRDAALLAIRLYRDRFGFPFVSAIATPTADELLMRVRIRLGNEPEPEGRAAREHLRRVVRRRMQDLRETDAAG